MYNGITRAIEPELVPCLRKNKIRLVIYNPLAGTLIVSLQHPQLTNKHILICLDRPGGFFTGKLSSVTDKAEVGTRFDDSSDSKMAAMYRKRYMNDAYIGALDILKTVAVRPFCSTPRQLRTCAGICRANLLTYSITG